MNVDEIRKHFPVLNRYTYLNTPASGILHEDIYNWRKKYEKQFLEEGSIYRDNIFEDLQSVKVQVAKTFHGKQDRVALIPNFSIGANMIFDSLPKTMSVLSIQGDYPSLVLPIQSRGFKHLEVPLFMLSEAAIAEMIRDKQIDVLAVSMTQWINGFYLKTDFFQRLKIDFPNLIILVDGTQSMGTAPFYFDKSGIDIMITSAYKWLISGYGCGFMMFSERVWDFLDVRYRGNATEMTRQFTPFHNNAQDFEPGHLDYLAFGSMSKAIAYLDKLGLDNIEKQISKVSLHAKTQLVHMGYLSPKVLGGAIHRNIIHFLGSEQLVNFLKENDILVSYRQGLRLGIHFYNTEGDINQFLKAIRVFR
jgi:selenocysteine lyase/cysteine desulfurase